MDVILIDSTAEAAERGKAYSVKLLEKAVSLYQDEPEYLWIHNEHVRGEGYDCSWCHTFSRPERGLRVSPIIAKLGDLINILRVLVGFPVAPSQTVEDINGDSHIGLEEAVDILRDISND